MLLFYATGLISPVYAVDEAKSLPLKGEVRTNRVDSFSPDQTNLPKDSDPFSDDSAPEVLSTSGTKSGTKASTKSGTSSSSSTSTNTGTKARTNSGTKQTYVNPPNVIVKIDSNYQKGIDAEQRDDLATAIENYVISVNNDPSNQEFVDALRRVELKFKSKCPKFHAYTSYFTGKHDARLLLNYGVRLYSLSCFQQAERLFNRAAELDPSNPNAQFNLGVIYEHNGQLSKALSKYQKSLSLFKLHGPDLPATAATIAQNARKQALKGKIAKVDHERRRFSGMEDPKNGRQLAQDAVNSVLQQMKGKPDNLPKWPTLTVNQGGAGQRTVTTQRHVDTCDHCLIIRNVEMWPN